MAACCSCRGNYCGCCCCVHRASVVARSEPEELNKKAVTIISRVRDKLTGRDFGSGDPVDVPTQVSLLVKQATSHESLCQCYIGWYMLLLLLSWLSNNAVFALCLPSLL